MGASDIGGEDDDGDGVEVKDGGSLGLGKLVHT